MYRSTKRKPEQLNQPEIPIKARYLLRLYAELVQGRQNGMGTNPISALEIQAWLNITNRTLSEWEIYTLRAMDKGFMNVN